MSSSSVWLSGCSCVPGQHVDVAEKRRAEQQVARELRAEKLSMVDTLLWNTDFLQQNGHPAATPGKPRYLSATAAA